MTEFGPTNESRRETILERSPILKEFLETDLTSPYWYDCLEWMVNEKSRNVNEDFDWELNVVPPLVTLLNSQGIFDGIPIEDLTNVVKTLNIAGFEIGYLSDTQFMSHEVSAKLYKSELVRSGIKADLLNGTVCGLMVNGIFLSDMSEIKNREDDDECETPDDGLIGYMFDVLQRVVQDMEPDGSSDPVVPEIFTDFVNNQLDDNNYLLSEG